MNEWRPSCRRCRRPISACFCALLPRLEPRTRVVFLQHPRERRVAISTCRMAHLALAGSELYQGVLFDALPVLQAISAEARAGGGVAVLFPGEGAVDPRTVEPGWLRTLVVVDGTWSQARKLVARSRLLRPLLRLGLVPSRPSNYRIRREPDAHSVSTIEAVVEVLGLLEGEPGRFRAALAPFDRMVDLQIERRAARIGPARYKRKRTHEPRTVPVPPALSEGFEHAVVFYVETNAGVDAAGAPLPAEPLQLCAARLATGERLHLPIRPAGALGAEVARHLELDEEALVRGEPAGHALARLASFLGNGSNGGSGSAGLLRNGTDSTGVPGSDGSDGKNGSLLCGWGRFGRDALAAALGRDDLPYVDLRVWAARRLGRRAGGIEQAALLLGAPVGPAWAPGRGGRRIVALEAIARALAGRGTVSAARPEAAPDAAPLPSAARRPP